MQAEHTPRRGIKPLAANNWKTHDFDLFVFDRPPNLCNFWLFFMPLTPCNWLSPMQPCAIEWSRCGCHFLGVRQHVTVYGFLMRTIQLHEHVFQYAKPEREIAQLKPCFEPQGLMVQNVHVSSDVTWNSNCYTSDLCVSSHDMYDMRAQCTMFWTPPLEVDFQVKFQLSFSDFYVVLSCKSWAFKGIAQIPFSVSPFLSFYCSPHHSSDFHGSLHQPVCKFWSHDLMSRRNWLQLVCNFSQNVVSRHRPAHVPAFKLSNKSNTKCCISAASLKWFRANAWLISSRTPTTKAVVGPSWSPAATGATGGSSSCSSDSARSSTVSSVSWPAVVPGFCCRTTWRKCCCPITRDTMRFSDFCWYIWRRLNQNHQ